MGSWQVASFDSTGTPADVSRDSAWCNGTSGRAGIYYELPRIPEQSAQENIMIKAGDRLSEATLNELTVEYTQGCPTSPEAYKVSDLTAASAL
jgi:hypothetical protein